MQGLGCGLLGLRVFLVMADQDFELRWKVCGFSRGMGPFKRCKGSAHCRGFFVRVNCIGPLKKQQAVQSYP